MEMINKLFILNENTKLMIYGSIQKPYFIASVVAQILGYVNTNQAIISNVWEENVITMAELQKIKAFDTKYQMNTKLISEEGLYQLIFASKLNNSRKEIAKQFKKWVFNEVLPSLRKTGQYQMPKLVNDQMLLLNEQDLHHKIVKYFRETYPSHKIHYRAGLGEIQDTDKKRIYAYNSGYCKGEPDFTICAVSTPTIASLPNEKAYNGLAFEFRKGVLSDVEKNAIQNLKDQNYKVIVTSNFAVAIRELTIYMQHVRIKCSHCNCRFTCNTKKYNNHLKYFHKLNNN